MNLDITIKSNAVIATNVQKVSEYYLQELKKYEGLVATKDTLKDDKKKCTDINKLKKFVSEQRIAFDKAVNAQPDVLAVHNALKAIEEKCDAVRAPYWKSCKAIEDADKPEEERFDIRLAIENVTAGQIESIKKRLVNDGIKFETLDIHAVKEGK